MRCREKENFLETAATKTKQKGKVKTIKGSIFVITEREGEVEGETE